MLVLLGQDPREYEAMTVLVCAFTKGYEVMPWVFLVPWWNEDQHVENGKCAGERD